MGESSSDKTTRGRCRNSLYVRRIGRGYRTQSLLDLTGIDVITLLFIFLNDVIFQGVFVYKGQEISEGNFGVFNFFKQNRKKIFQEIGLENRGRGYTLHRGSSSICWVLVRDLAIDMHFLVS